MSPRKIFIIVTVLGATARPRRAAVVATLGTIVLAGSATLGLYLAASGAEDEIAGGVRIGQVDVGGLTAGEAERKLERELLGPLRRPLVVRSGEQEFPLSFREARIRADIPASVHEAVERSREGSWLGRGLRAVTGADEDIAIRPVITYDRPAVQRLVDKVRVQMSREVRDATVDYDPETGITVHRAREGRTIDPRALRTRMQQLVVDPTATREVRAKLVKTAPRVTTRAIARRYPVLLTVDREHFRIRLFKDLKQVKSFPIALGQIGLDTPSGRFRIQSKQVDPAWHVPDSAWAGDLAGTTIPGGIPGNPLKARWMGVDGAVGVHGTADRASMGSFASHGCIRMLVEDVEELYDEVSVGTPIFIS